MITEDYVSFGTAKLMKEKEFNADVNCTHVYVYGRVVSKDYFRDINELEEYIQAPTLQMAMKWLREVHNISIEPLVDFGNGNEYWWAVDVAYIKKNGLIDELCGYNSYEEACEAGIKYCLENLI